jgi:hypothetical protein
MLDNASMSTSQLKSNPLLDAGLKEFDLAAEDLAKAPKVRLDLHRGISRDLVGRICAVPKQAEIKHAVAAGQPVGRH